MMDQRTYKIIGASMEKGQDGGRKKKEEGRWKIEQARLEGEKIQPWITDYSYRLPFMALKID